MLGKSLVRHDFTRRWQDSLVWAGCRWVLGFDRAIVRRPNGAVATEMCANLLICEGAL